MSTEFTPDDGDLESAVQSYWRRVDAYEQSTGDGDETLFFLDGPPNPSGKTHLGTIWNKVLKDVVLRTARMSGLSVVDVPGYDTHLFTTEQRVTEQREASPTDLEGDGLAAFEEACESFEGQHVDQLEDDFRTFGVWMDWDAAYRTDSGEYADAAWWTFARMYDRDTATRQEQVTHWCPSCERALYKRSEYEADHLPFQDPPEDDAVPVFVAYPLADEDAVVVTRADAAWRVLYNTFLTVDPEQRYVGIETADHGTAYVAAEQTAEAFRSAGLDEVTERFDGEVLLGRRYRHPLSEALGADRTGAATGEIVADGRATATGVGHGTPGCDEADRQFARENDLPVVDPLTDDGLVDGTAGSYAGVRVDTSLGRDVRADLAERGALVRRGAARPRTKTCWCCGSDVVPRLGEQWYVSLEGEEAVLDEAIASTDWLPEDLEDTMSTPDAWHPDWSRDSRFDAAPDANHDWLVQQESHWGLPIPVWVSEDDPSDVVVVESRAELCRRADQSLDPATLEPRRSVLDEVTITEGGTTYVRDPGVFADRFTAAVAAVAVGDHHESATPFEDGDAVDLIVEARDQPGLWFFMQLAIGVAALDRMPFDRAFMHGFLTDEDGEKMSKSVGNVVTPDEVVARHSADATRLFLAANTEPDVDLSLDWDEIAAIDATLDRLIDASEAVVQDRGGDADAGVSTAALSDMVRDRVEQTADEVAAATEAFAFDDAASAVLDLVDWVAETYVPLLRTAGGRERVASDGGRGDALDVLGETARLLAPYAPHVAEVVYQTVGGPEATVHAARLPGGRAPATAWRSGDGAFEAAGAEPGDAS